THATLIYTLSLHDALPISFTNAFRKMNEEKNTALSSSEGTRVLLFIQLLELGGSETQCVELARRLAAEGYSVTVGCLRAGGPLRSEEHTSELQSLRHLVCR